MIDNGIVVEDNYLDDMYFAAIKAVLLDRTQAGWIFTDSTLDDYGEEDQPRFPMIVKMVYQDYMIQDRLWEYLRDLFVQMQVLQLIRCKANITFPQEGHRDLGWHVDLHNMTHIKEMRTAILFFNDVPDAVTKIDTGDGIIEVETKANRLVSFPTHMRHTGTTFNEAEYRALLNINYLEGHNLVPTT